MEQEKERNLNAFYMVIFYFKKSFRSFWFYIALFFTPLFFDLAFFTQTPTVLSIDSTIAYSIIFNTFLFYSLIFFNIRRSNFYFLIKQKTRNKFEIYFPIFINLLIAAFLTFFISLSYLYLFNALNIVVFWDLQNSNVIHYQIKDFSQLRWGILIYYILIIFFESFVIAFLIQSFSQNLKNYFLIVLFVLLIIFLFSATFVFRSVFSKPYVGSDDAINYYSYNQDTQVLTFKPYFDRSEKVDKRFFYDFSIFQFFHMLNPFYWIIQWSQYDVFVNFYRTTSITLPGTDQIVINPLDPSTWVLFRYQMFSFSCLLWSSYIFVPYIYLIFFGFLGIYISKRKNNNENI